MGTWKSFVLFLLVMAGCAGPLLGADCTCDVNRDGEITPLDALVLSDKIRGNCPTSLGIPCEDICSDVNGDGSLNDEDVNMIFDRFFGQAGKCAAIPVCDQCYYKQDRAKQTIRDIASYMEKFYAEHDYYLFSMDKFGISVKKDSYYEYSIHEVENDPESYRIIASSKSPGINGGGKGDDVWTFERINSTGLNLIHTVNGCPVCPENNCFSCLWNQESVKKNLTTISRNEEAYFSEYDTYTGSLSEIGFSPSVYDKYVYTIAADNKSFLATASSKAPGIMGGGAGDDVWTIDQSLTMNNTANACYDCPALYRNSCEECSEKQKEAKQSLGTIAINQEAYYSEHDIYANKTESIGFAVRGVPQYEYFLQSAGDTYIAIAVSKEPGIMGNGGGDDIWMINNDLELSHIINACPACSGITSETLRSEIMKTICSYSECKSKQADAKQTLGTIAKNEEAYLNEYDTYTDSFKAMGFYAGRYSLYQLAVEVNDGGNSFTATATSKSPGINWGGAGDDVWSIDQEYTLINVLNACSCYSDDTQTGNPCWQPNQVDLAGHTGEIYHQKDRYYLAVNLTDTHNSLTSFGFDILYDSTVLHLNDTDPHYGSFDLLFDKFSVREISPGRIRVGGYTTGTPIPENTDGVLATLSFDILGPCSTDLKFVSLKDNMISWQEHTLRYSAGNELAHAIALLRIAAGQNAEIPACIPDIGNDGRKGLAEAVYLLQETAGLR